MDNVPLFIIYLETVQHPASVRDRCTNLSRLSASLNIIHLKVPHELRLLLLV